jgi:hypothetical protein
VCDLVPPLLQGTRWRCTFVFACQCNNKFAVRPRLTRREPRRHATPFRGCRLLTVVRGRRGMDGFEICISGRGVPIDESLVSVSTTPLIIQMAPLQQHCVALDEQKPLVTKRPAPLSHHHQRPKVSGLAKFTICLFSENGSI